MNTPNLPTDSLYKFLALSGVFLFVASMYLPFHMFSGIVEDAAEASTDVGILTHQYSFNLKNLGLPGIGEEDSLSIPRRFAVVLDTLEARGHELDPEALDRLERWWAARTALMARFDSWGTLQRFAKVGVWVGIVAALFGFTLWYIQLQRHVDRYMARRADLAPPQSGRRHKFE